MRNTVRKTISLSRPTAGHFYTPGALDSLERAASRLGIGADALRHHCERLAEQCGDVAIAHLPDGTVAFKVGDSWKFRFPIVAGHAAGERSEP